MSIFGGGLEGAFGGGRAEEEDGAVVGLEGVAIVGKSALGTIEGWFGPDWSCERTPGAGRGASELGGGVKLGGG